MGAKVLHNVSFHLEPGSFHFLTGPSGAGKTSLLKIMYLSRRPSHGLITMFGEDLSALSRENFPEIRRRIGVVFQDFRLVDHLTAFENVALPLRIVGARTHDFREDVEELLTWVGLGDRMDAKPPTLSGGEQQRIAIARAVVAKPDLLLADEPTGSVDPDIGQRLVGLFVELNKLGTTVVIATHDRNQLSKMAAPILRLDKGSLSLWPPAQFGLVE
jgi:cell division transport system ATP-binding protein